MSDYVVLSHVSGATATIHCFGATVTSWMLPSGKEMFYLSKLSDTTGVKPIRGGIPVVFPQFANEGPIVKHGFARTSIWSADPVIEEDGFVCCTFHLKDSERTRAIWDHAFELVYIIRLGEKSLSTELKIHNPSTESFDCQCLLHSYYAVPSIDSTTVKGMKEHTGVESVSTGKRRGRNEVDSILEELFDAVICYDDQFIEMDEEINFTKETDAKYHAVSMPVTITTNDRVITLKISGFATNASQTIPDCVVWNAWIDKCHGIGDMEDDDYKRYVCVEPGHVWGTRTVAKDEWLMLKQVMEVEEK